MSASVVIPDNLHRIPSMDATSRRRVSHGSDLALFDVGFCDVVDDCAQVWDVFHDAGNEWEIPRSD